MSKKWLCILLAAVSGVVWAQPVVPAGGTVNAADYSRAIAPGSIITVFGQNLAPGVEGAGGLPLPTALAGTSVEASDGTRTVLLPLYVVLETQVSGQLPYDIGPNVTVRVRTAEGVSDPDSFTLAPRAPRLFSVDQQGSGRAVLLHPDGELVSRQNPMKPGEWVSIYANSMGAVHPPIEAGMGAADGSTGNPWNVVTAEVGVTIGGRDATVDYAGLAPYLAGLYQVNVFTPYYDLMGDLLIAMGVGAAGSQGNISAPVEPNGFYLLLGAGKFPNGQAKNAIGVTRSAVAFLHETPEIWGQDGFGQWTHNSHLGQPFAATSGLALTLMSGGAILYDNNGIEDGSHAGYYDNGNGGVPDADKPGLWEWYSMSNNLNAVFAGYFRLTQWTTFDRIIGYFDGNGNSELPFDPENAYNRFRMNIWSNGAGDFPALAGFTGNVLSSDSTPGVFEFSPTQVERVFSDGFRDRIYRMVYTLETPITLEPGEYWFSHDTAVPEGMSSPATTQGRAVSRAVRAIPSAAIQLAR